MSTINYFRSQFAFLSNFYPVPIAYDQRVFVTLEHAYQASKTLDWAERNAIQRCKTAGAAKALGRRVTMRPEFESIKHEVMLRLLRMKFDREVQPLLAAQLIETHPHDLVHENTWGDIHWGVCRGVGENFLGRLLMTVRSEITPKVIIT